MKIETKPITSKRQDPKKLSLIPNALRHPARIYPTAMTFIKRKPFTSFLLSLLLLTLLIIGGATAFKTPVQEISQEPVVKDVAIYRTGTTPKSTFQAQVEKSNVIKVMSQTAGIVQSINVKEGSVVSRGANLVIFSSNYQGSNAPALQGALAAKQLTLANENFTAQTEIIAKQREIANQTGTNTEKMRDISSQSVGETRSLIDLNQQILETLDQNIKTLEETNVNNANSAAILQAKQGKAQLQGGLNQLRSALRNVEYQTDTNNPPTQLANLQKDITLKQLDLQEKSLQINREVAQLQAGLAAVNEALMRPSAPIAGTVDRVYVRPGQMVNPATPILLISGANQGAVAVVKLPKEAAENISSLETATIHAAGQTFNLTPEHISTEATDGTMYSVTYRIPNDYVRYLSDGETISVDIPIVSPVASLSRPTVPLDAVYQTQDQAYVYVMQEGKAVSKKVTLGKVVGKYVIVTSGLNTNDPVILSRNVLEGDQVKTASIPN